MTTTQTEHVFLIVGADTRGAKVRAALLVAATPTDESAGDPEHADGLYRREARVLHITDDGQLSTALNVPHARQPYRGHAYCWLYPFEARDRYPEARDIDKRTPAQRAHVPPYVARELQQPAPRTATPARHRAIRRARTPATKKS